MNRTFDLFEILPDGAPIWRDAVSSHENAALKMQELAARTENELRLMDLRNNAVIAAMSARQS
jgi:hypothetical protein